MDNNYNFKVSKIFKDAEAEMLALHHPYVGSEHLLLSILKNSQEICDIANTYDRLNTIPTYLSDNIMFTYINANVTISVILPLTTKKVDFITQILVCENIIVGEVPQFYFTSGDSVF